MNYWLPIKSKVFSWNRIPGSSEKRSVVTVYRTLDTLHREGTEEEVMTGSPTMNGNLNLWIFFYVLYIILKFLHKWTLRKQICNEKIILKVNSDTRVSVYLSPSLLPTSIKERKPMPRTEKDTIRTVQKAESGPVGNHSTGQSLICINKSSHPVSITLSIF